MENLIGKQFKRNVYGLTDWIDTVENVYIIRSYITKNTWKPVIQIKGKIGIWSYDIDEIVFVN